jgi:hypothetical protein
MELLRTLNSSTTSITAQHSSFCLPTAIFYFSQFVVRMTFWLFPQCRFVGVDTGPKLRIWRHYVSPKRWCLPTSLQGVKTQNNIAILTAVRRQISRRTLEAVIICSFCGPCRVLTSLLGFLNLIRHVAGLLWTNHQLVAKAFPDTGHHNV